MRQTLLASVQEALGYCFAACTLKARAVRLDWRRVSSFSEACLLPIRGRDTLSRLNRAEGAEGDHLQDVMSRLRAEPASKQSVKSWQSL